jgi:hypothetical protein
MKTIGQHVDRSWNERLEDSNVGFVDTWITNIRFQDNKQSSDEEAAGTSVPKDEIENDMQYPFYTEPSKSNLSLIWHDNQGFVRPGL